MSQLVRLGGKHTAQTAHCAMEVRHIFEMLEVLHQKNMKIETIGREQC